MVIEYRWTVALCIMSFCDLHSLSSFSSACGTHKSRKQQCQENIKPDEGGEYCVWPGSYESDTKNGRLRCHDVAINFPVPTDSVLVVAQHYEGGEGPPGSIPNV